MLTLDERTTIYTRIRSTLITTLQAVREESGGADPRPVLKSRFDGAGGASASGRQHDALMTLLGLTEGAVSPDEFNDMVNAAYIAL